MLNLYNWGTDTMRFKLLILNNKIHVCTHTTIFSFISLNGLFLLSWTFGSPELFPISPKIQVKWNQVYIPSQSKAIHALSGQNQEDMHSEWLFLTFKKCFFQEISDSSPQLCDGRIAGRLWSTFPNLEDTHDIWCD